MASIQKRDSRWLARYRDNTGREHARRFDRKIDAQRWLDEQTTALITGQYCDPRAGRSTFRQCADQWRATAPHGPTTTYLVARALEKHVYPVIGDLPIGAIRTTRVQALAAITLDVYSHLWPDADDRTREAVEQALTEALADTVRTDERSS